MFVSEAPANRQEIATFIRRALMYVEKNSEYSDRNQLASWAEEPMAFMNALGLMESKTASEIAPEEKCSIEQALIIAEKSVYAHQIGWYQAQSTLEKTEGGWSSFVV